MRTVKEIKDSMTARWIIDAGVQTKYGLVTGKTFDEQFSKVSLESIWFYVVAFCVWTLESLFESHRAEMEYLYLQHHAHTFEWYNGKARAFMYGCSLVPFTSNYDVSGLTDEQIAAAKLVAHASCVKGFNANNVSFLRLKVAKANGDSLKALSATELAAFADYIAEIQDAGIDVRCTSNEADRIYMKWIVYYDPQVLDGEGNRLDGDGSDVVRQAIKDYTHSLPFNGLYKLTYHIDWLQALRGVKDAYIVSASSRPELATVQSSVTDAGTVADAGYFAFYADADLEVVMIPFSS